MDNWNAAVTAILTFLGTGGGLSILFTYLHNRSAARGKKEREDQKWINDRYREQLKLKDDELAATKLAHAVELKQVRDDCRDEFDRLRKIVADMESELERQRDRIAAVLVERTNLRAKLAAFQKDDNEQ